MLLAKPSGVLLRSFLLSLYLLVFTIPYALLCFLVFPFMNARRRYAMAATWCRITLWMLRTLNGITYQFKGFDNLPNGPAVLLSKHQSAWETLAFPALMPRPLCFVFKRELVFIPFFGWTLGMLKMVQIDRRKGHSAFASMLRQGRARLAEGAWVIMFPEGTRTPIGVRGQYKTGGAHFAVSAGVPVIPIAHNAGHVWPRNSFIKYPGVVTLSIGPAIQTAGRTPAEVNAEVAAWIETEMQCIDPDAYL